MVVSVILLHLEALNALLKESPTIQEDGIGLLHKVIEPDAESDLETLLDSHKYSTVIDF